MSSDTPERTVADIEVRALAAERLTFFADAVLAIAITLLALELPMPEGTTGSQLLHSFEAHRSAYITFLISFAVIGGHWNAHHRLFRYVTSVDGGIVRLSFGWLLMQVLTPFATKVLAADGGFEVRFIFYALVQVVALALFLVMARRIRHRRLHREDTPPELFRQIDIGIGTVAVAFAVSIPVALFTEGAYACWIAVPLIGRIVNRIVRRESLD